jgi:hypothetical protein
MYNQLIEFVYSEDNSDRLYVKNLLKHKHYSLTAGEKGDNQYGQYELPSMPDNNTNTRARGVTANNKPARKSVENNHSRKHRASKDNEL